MCNKILNKKRNLIDKLLTQIRKNVYLNNLNF